MTVLQGLFQGCYEGSGVGGSAAFTVLGCMALDCKWLALGLKAGPRKLVARFTLEN